MNATDPTAVWQQQARHYRIVERAIHYLHDHASAQPRLADVAAAVHVSEHHLQRVFAQWAGVSPKRFLQYLSKERALEALRRTEDLLSAADVAAVSSLGRLHDLMVSTEALTPGEIRAAGKGVVMRFGWAPTPVGEALLAWSERGLCHLAFSTDAPERDLQALHDAWPAASWVPDAPGAAAYVDRIFGVPTGTALNVRQPLHVLLKGTNFQIKVWEALLRIPMGELASYTQIAQCAGVPLGQRAVGSALATNVIGYLIPCHRVIRGSGMFGAYRWGRERKAALQGWEAAQRHLSG